MKKRSLNLLKTLVLIGLIPLIAMSICLFFVAVNKLNTTLDASTFNRLKVAAEGMERYYGYDIRNDVTVDHEYSYVDNYKKQGLELTLFIGDTRYITSIYDEKTQQRNEGTKADSRIFKIVSSGKDYKAKNVVIGGDKYYVYYTPILDDSGKFYGMAFAGESQKMVQKEVRSVTISVLITTLVLAIVFAAIVIWLALKIRKPIVQVVYNINDLSKGALSTEITAKSKISEIITLVDAARNLKERLATVVGEVNEQLVSLDNNMDQVADGVTTSNVAAEGIVTAVEELASGTMDMADSVQNCTISMQSIGDEIAQITNLSIEANQNAEDVRGVSDDAKDELQKLMVANGDTISVSKDVVSGINEANEAAERIKTAADLITNIAGETNLLSLNASIEAARAGEAGRGFAVVAANIQALANQSDESAKEIQSVIRNIIEISENNVMLANSIKDAVDNEGTVLGKVNKSFDIVNEKVQDTASAVSSIHEKTVVLNDAKDAVLDEVSTLSAISEENAASCEETNASMEELKANMDTIHNQSEDTKEITRKVSEVFSYFKL